MDADPKAVAALAEALHAGCLELDPACTLRPQRAEAERAAAYLAAHGWRLEQAAEDALIDEALGHIAALMREVPSWKPAYYEAEDWLRDVAARVAAEEGR